MTTAAAEHGPWQPLTPTELGRLLDGVATTWWLMGGLALDRFVGRVTRPHDDVDIEIPRAGLGA
ncbi:nucleotidyltransferase domain-containing protein, partial [Iamia sp.]|uniref:nucleotidyltransferase domain-containing protein n=1 Tax=Iamia sp. TaxID=2722710 RepID=UPI002BAD2773|nr:hypothetical protein [Iamia sp.]